MPKEIYEDKNVYPGEKLAVIEVLENGLGAYQFDGEIRSSELGRAHFDLEQRKVTVEKKTRELILPKKGSVVIAEAGSVMRRDARVDIFMIDSNFVFVPYTGVIHISDAGRDFVKDMSNAVRNGDIIKAEIINTSNLMIQLGIDGSEYGVIYAYCSRCGKVLEKQGNRLHCTKCDRTERRKIAKSYGMENLV